MNIALIKNGICVNVVVFDTLEKARECLSLLGEYDEIIECPNGHGIGHEYRNGNWNIPIENKEA